MRTRTLSCMLLISTCTSPSSIQNGNSNSSVTSLSASAKYTAGSLHMRGMACYDVAIGSLLDTLQHMLSPAMAHGGCIQRTPSLSPRNSRCQDVPHSCFGSVSAICRLFAVLHCIICCGQVNMLMTAGICAIGGGSSRVDTYMFPMASRCRCRRPVYVLSVAVSRPVPAA